MEDNKFNIIMPEDDRIMAYFRGEMSEDEESIFMEEINNDDKLRENVVAVARIAKGMKSMGERMDDEIKRAVLATSPSCLRTLVERVSGKDDVESLFGMTADDIHFYLNLPERCSAQDKEEEAKKESKKSSRKAIAYISSLAASIVFIVFVGFQYNSYHKTTSLGTEYAMVFDASTLTRGDDNAKIMEELTHLFNNVVSKADTKQTIKRLNTLWELSTMDVYNDYTDYSQEIGWNLAIAYLMDNDKPQAKGVLEKLVSVSEAESAFGKKAKELLEKINDL